MLEFNVLLDEQRSRKEAPGLDRGRFRSILHNLGMSSDVLMHGGTFLFRLMSGNFQRKNAAHFKRKPFPRHHL